MNGVDTKLYSMYSLLELSYSYSFSQFQKADKNALRHKPWYLKEEIVKVKGVRKRPRVRFQGKQDVLYKQLYRYFIGDLPKEQLVPSNGRDDYNPWHWKAKGVTPTLPVTVELIVPDTLPPDLEDLANLIKTRRLHGHQNPWFEVDEIYSQDEIDEVREFLDAK